MYIQSISDMYNIQVYCVGLHHTENLKHVIINNFILNLKLVSHCYISLTECVITVSICLCIVVLCCPADIIYFT